MSRQIMRFRINGGARIFQALRRSREESLTARGGGPARDVGGKTNRRPVELVLARDPTAPQIPNPVRVKQRVPLCGDPNETPPLLSL